MQHPSRCSVHSGSTSEGPRAAAVRLSSRRATSRAREVQAGKAKGSRKPTDSTIPRPPNDESWPLVLASSRPLNRQQVAVDHADLVHSDPRTILPRRLEELALRAGAWLRAAYRRPKAVLACTVPPSPCDAITCANVDEELDATMKPHLVEAGCVRRHRAHERRRRTGRGGEATSCWD